MSEKMWPYRYKIYGDLGGDAQYNLDALNKNELYYPTAKKFNDPFDCAPSSEVLSIDMCLQIAKGKLKAEPRIKVFGHPNFTREQILDYMARDIQNSNSGPEMRDLFYRDFGILCLTRDPTSILMWSHYGKNHTGFAIEFDYRYSNAFNSDSSISSAEYGLITKPIRYTKHRPTFEFKASTGDPFHGFLEKAECWSYEKEDRVISETGDRRYPFDPTLVSAVLLGARCDTETVDTLEKAVNSFNQRISSRVPIYRVELDELNYRLLIPRHSYFGNPNYNDVI